jgi:hypothetical protein
MRLHWGISFVYFYKFQRDLVINLNLHMPDPIHMIVGGPFLEVSPPTWRCICGFVIFPEKFQAFGPSGPPAEKLAVRTPKSSAPATHTFSPRIG